MTRRHIIFSAAATALLVGCASRPNISTDYDPQASFSGLTTYEWAVRTESGDDDPRVFNAITAGRVKNAVNTALPTQTAAGTM